MTTITRYFYNRAEYTTEAEAAAAASTHLAELEADASEYATVKMCEANEDGSLVMYPDSVAHRIYDPTFNFIDHMRIVISCKTSGKTYTGLTVTEAVSLLQSTVLPDYINYAALTVQVVEVKVTNE